MPILACVKLEAKAGVLTIHATDIAQHQIENVPCDGDLPALCVNMQRLFVVLPAEGKLKLSVEGGKLQVKCGKQVSLLSIQEANDYPPIPETDGQVLQGIPCGDVAEGIRAVQFAAGTDMNNKPRYCAIHIESSPKLLRIEATSGFEFAIFERPLICPVINVSIPQEFGSRLADALESKGAELRMSDKGLLVTHETGSYYCAQSADAYPNTKPVRDYELKPLGELTLAPAVAIMDICFSLIDSTKTPAALLVFSKKGMAVDFNGVDSAVNMVVEGEFAEHEARINVTSFRKCLRAIKAEKCAMFSANEGQILAWTSGDFKFMSTTIK